MDRKELKAKLNQLDIKENQYSLYGELIPDRIILSQHEVKWEVFYFDERGSKNDQKIFDSEDEACIYIYKMFLDAKEIEKKYGINT